jgi:GNAT superfamily N-acetyltransferase
MAEIRRGARIDSMTVRPAKPEDAQVVHAILSSAPQPRTETREDLEAQFVEPTRDDGTGDWVVEDGQGVIGYLGLGLPTDKVQSLEVSVYLRDDMTGLGRGPKLLSQYLIPAAQEGGAQLLTATPHTEPAAKTLASCGFRRRDIPPVGDDPVAERFEKAPVLFVPWDRSLGEA